MNSSAARLSGRSYHSEHLASAAPVPTNLWRADERQEMEIMPEGFIGRFQGVTLLPPLFCGWHSVSWPRYTEKGAGTGSPGGTPASQQHMHLCPTCMVSFNPHITLQGR